MPDADSAPEAGAGQQRGIWHTAAVNRSRIFLAGIAIGGTLSAGADPLYTTVTPATAQTESRISQGLIDRQPALIDTEVARIAEKSSPVAQVYFLGFAGFGDDRVFADEIALAEERVAVRYGSDGRSLRLVNDHRDAERHPLATVASLRYSLDALGRVMDDDDVLFLALSSHGSDDGTIVISNPGMHSDSLSAAELAAALDHAGIRWRVIVISACYAGSFIPSLADDHTIVVTAAAKDRTSFGCSDDRHLTYFGEGFYRDALPAATSLRVAFEITQHEIRRREKQEHVRPSHPQAFFGAKIEQKLAGFETR
jgi:hypothetical protein